MTSAPCAPHGTGVPLQGQAGVHSAVFWDPKAYALWGHHIKENDTNLLCLKRAPGLAEVVQVWALELPQPCGEPSQGSWPFSSITHSPQPVTPGLLELQHPGHLSGLSQSPIHHSPKNVLLHTCLPTVLQQSCRPAQGHQAMVTNDLS